MESKTFTATEDQQCSHCGRFDNRGLSIEAIILKDGKILLGRRGGWPFKGCWGFFGGFVEFGETVEEALHRETWEESGLTVTSYRLIGVYSDPERHPRQVVTVAYAVEVDGQVQAGDDIAEVRWFSLNDLPELPFDHRRILGDCLRALEAD